MLLAEYQWNFLLNFCFVKVEIRLVSVKNEMFVIFVQIIFSDCFVYNASARHSLLSTEI